VAWLCWGVGDTVTGVIPVLLAALGEGLGVRVIRIHHRTCLILAVAVTPLTFQVTEVLSSVLWSGTEALVPAHLGL